MSHPKILTSEQVDAFVRDGYVVVDGVLSSEELTRFGHAVDAAVEGRAGADKRTLPEKSLYEQSFVQCINLWEDSVDVRRLTFDARIGEMAAQLLGADAVRIWHDQALYKPARDGGSVFWHQDNAYWKCIPANLASCWLTLDDVNVENGAMHLMPGSHLAPLGHDRSHSTCSLLDIGEEVDETQAAVIDLPAGGALFHHCQTMHYTCLLYTSDAADE
mgnify:CR=1 FL=1